MEKGASILKNQPKQNLYFDYAESTVKRKNFSRERYLLGGFCPSSDATQSASTTDDFCFRIPMECLGGESYARQLWFVDGVSTPQVSTQDGDVTLTSFCTDTFLFAAISLADNCLERQVRGAYRLLLEVLRDHGIHNLLRIWNFVPNINGFDVGVERYQLFNKGRRDALFEKGYALSGGVPAACALGTQTGGVHVIVLASTHPPIAIENPRQISSYRYPRQYGLQAPIFSRATWLQQPSGEDLLFISGTASIVGHQTLHAGDVLEQVKESVRNIEAVLYSANQRAGASLWKLCELKGRVYLRHVTDYGLIREHLFALGMTKFCFLAADICRSDLLVEIEAEGQSDHRRR